MLFFELYILFITLTLFKMKYSHELCKVISVLQFIFDFFFPWIKKKQKKEQKITYEHRHTYTHSFQLFFFLRKKKRSKFVRANSWKSSIFEWIIQLVKFFFRSFSILLNGIELKFYKKSTLAFDRRETHFTREKWLYKKGIKRKKKKKKHLLLQSSINDTPQGWM